MADTMPEPEPLALPVGQRVAVRADGQSGVVCDVLASQPARPYLVQLDHGAVGLYARPDLVSLPNRVDHPDCRPPPR